MRNVLTDEETSGAEVLSVIEIALIKQGAVNNEWNIKLPYWLPPKRNFRFNATKEICV